MKFISQEPMGLRSKGRANLLDLSGDSPDGVASPRTSDSLGDVAYRDTICEGGKPTRNRKRERLDIIILTERLLLSWNLAYGKGAEIVIQQTESQYKAASRLLGGLG